MTLQLLTEIIVLVLKGKNRTGIMESSDKNGITVESQNTDFVYVGVIKKG